MPPLLYCTSVTSPLQTFQTSLLNPNPPTQFMPHFNYPYHFEHDILERKNFFLTKCLEKMRVSKRTEKQSTFDIDLLGWDDAKLWSSLFGVDLQLQKDSDSLLKYPQHSHQKSSGKKFSNGHELNTIFPGITNCYCARQISCLFLASMIMD